MATGSRTLKLSILADIDDLKKNLNVGTTEVQSFGDKLEGFGKKAGLAFAAATAAAALYAGKLLKEGVESAIADEKAQASLAKTLENVTGATNSQIKSVEDYILQTSLATGITDDQLRPSLDRLVRSTKDVDEAQKLQTLALDIAAGSGKSLTQVSESLARAHDGNFTSLKKLGVPLDESIIKSKDFDAATKALASTFKDQASVQADTFQGKMSRLKVALDEAKESVGAALLPQITKLVDYIVENVLPNINAFVAGLTGNDGVKKSLDKTGSAAYDLGSSLRDATGNLLKLFGVFNDNENTGSSSGLAKLIGWADNVIKVFSKMIEVVSYTFALLKVVSNPSNWGLSGTETAAKAAAIAGIVSKTVSNTSVNRSSTPMNIDYGTGGGGTGGSGGGGTSISNAISSAVSNALPKNIQYQPLPQLSASEALFSSLTGTSGNFPSGVSPFLAQSPNISITVNGAIDPTSTARQIANILNTEATVSGAFLELGQSRLI